MITFDHVSKTYPDGSTAVHDFSLVIPSHHIVSLVGTSGSGKTTLIRMVNRMTEPTRGHVCIDDHNVMDESAVDLRRRIGYVIQSGGLMPHKTVEANIAVVPTLLGTPRREARKNARKIMERVGLDPALAKRYPHQLSGGQRQRVLLAMALVNSPDLLICDEPTTALDVTVQAQVLTTIDQVLDSVGAACFFTTHDLAVVSPICHDLIVMTSGQIVETGPARTVLSEPDHPYTRRLLRAARLDLVEPGTTIVLEDS